MASGAPSDELSLIRRIVAGEREAFAHLVRAYQAPVLRLCQSMLNDAALAEDAAQDAFLKAYEALPSFRQASRFSTWLYRIAANRCLDLIRKRRREPAESWDALVEQEGEPPRDRTAPAPDPAGQLANADLIRQTLAQLPPEYRLVLVLREVQGLSYQEIAATLDCSVDAVKARLRRAREALLDRARHFLRIGGV
jgi:RNA polymerase sigma-70 factor (ECF subfamily)